MRSCVRSVSHHPSRVPATQAFAVTNVTNLTSSGHLRQVRHLRPIEDRFTAGQKPVGVHQTCEFDLPAEASDGGNEATGWPRHRVDLYEASPPLILFPCPYLSRGSETGRSGPLPRPQTGHRACGFEVEVVHIPEGVVHSAVL